MNSKLTAAQARELAGPTIDDHVAAALVVIKTNAEAKKRKAALHDDFWVRGGYGSTDEWNAAVKQLTDLGYHVWFFYQESQFVDMYTVVEW